MKQKQCTLLHTSQVFNTKTKGQSHLLINAVALVGKTPSLDSEIQSYCQYRIIESYFVALFGKTPSPGSETQELLYHRKSYFVALLGKIHP